MVTDELPWSMKVRVVWPQIRRSRVTGICSNRFWRPYSGGGDCRSNGGGGGDGRSNGGGGGGDGRSNGGGGGDGRDGDGT